jgi:DNA-binding MarR family transcriptional regulator
MSPIWTRSYGFDVPLMISIVLRLHRLMIEDLRRRLRPLGLHPGQDRLLLEIHEYSQGEYVQEFVDRYDISKQTIQRALRRAEAAGLVELRPWIWGSRRQRIRLTPEGRDLIEPIRKVWEAVESGMRSAMNADMTGEEEEATLEAMCKAMGGLGRIVRHRPTMKDLRPYSWDPRYDDDIASDAGRV